jgi:two-component system, cell cycle sensor histidine kinase and response regulator CckA
MTPDVGGTLELRSSESHGHLRSLLQAHKIELIDELAQAMANQFNNIMMAVTGYAELELRKTTTNRRELEQVITHATRATSLIQKFLDSSRRHSSMPQPLELDDLVSEIGDLMKDLLGEQADLRLRLDANSVNIHADRINVEQTLLALVLIARNSMASGGQLRISTALTDLDREFIGEQDTAEPGQYVVLSIENDTPAVRTDSAAHVDLDQSQRVSLSLAAVRGILKECHGLARFSSDPSARSSFQLYFPVWRQEAFEAQSASLPRIPAIARTVLIVEDDDAVRVPAVEFLMMEGFKVLQAKTGAEALNVVQQSRSSLDILIADIFMPKMNGYQVAAKLLEQHPDLKILYISGDPGRSSLGMGESPQPATLRKPFRLNVLRDKIHDLLGE